MGTSGGKTQTTTNEPPAYVQPFAREYLGRASELSRTPFQMYTGNNFTQPQGTMAMPTREQFTKAPTTSMGRALNQTQHATPDMRGQWENGKLQGQPTGGGFDEAGYNAAMEKYNSQVGGQSINPQQYINARIAPMTQEQNEGLDLTAQRAREGSAVMNAAKGNLEATLRGDYLNADTNPYLKGAVDRQLNDIQSRINTQFSGNNFGTTGHQEWLGKNLADTALPIYAQNYDQERTRQMQANLFAPQMANSDYDDLRALLGVGDTRQAFNQQGLDAKYDLWNQLQQYPYQQNDYLGGAVAGSPGSQTTGPNPYQSNRAAGALGGVAAGAGIGAAMAPAGATGMAALGGPAGLGIMAGLGLLGSGIL